MTISFNAKYNFHEGFNLANFLSSEISEIKSLAKLSGFTVFSYKCYPAFNEKAVKSKTYCALKYAWFYVVQY